jgi:hypothetical protein
MGPSAEDLELMWINLVPDLQEALRLYLVRVESLHSAGYPDCSDRHLAHCWLLLKDLESFELNPKLIPD